MSSPPLVLLVANDRHHEATALTEILTDEGIDVIHEHTAAVSPDVIIVDENAAPFCELIRLVEQLHVRFPQAVTVLLTSGFDSAPEVRAVVGPVNGICLEKPIDVRELVTLARRHSDGVGRAIARAI